MFQRQCAARQPDSSKPDQVSRRQVLQDLFREISNHPSPDVLREFREMVIIVLDRSQFNRINSHTSSSKGCWIFLNAADEPLDGASDFALFGLIFYPLARRPKE
jgi:hypothetical protein